MKYELVQIAKAYCKREGHTYLFANEDKFGFETKDGMLWTMTWWELYEALND